MAAIPISDLLLYLHDGSAARLLTMDPNTGDWHEFINSPGGDTVTAGQMMRLTASLIAFRKSTSTGAGSPPWPPGGETRGTMAISTDGGATWTDTSIPVLPSASNENADTYAWAVSTDGIDIYAGWADDLGGTVPGGYGVNVHTDDNGATWSDDVGTPNLSYLIISHMALHPNGEIATALTSPFYPYAYGEVWLQAYDQSGGVDTWWDSTYINALSEDNAVLVAWGLSNRIITAIREAHYDETNLRALIVGFDRFAGIGPNGSELNGYYWNADTGGTVLYDTVDRGRPIGLIHAGGGILFVGWEDGTISRSSNNGDTWADMTQGATVFTSADSMTYDSGPDLLWVVGKDGSDMLVQVWTDASATGDAAEDATRNIQSVGTLGATRTGGHLGLVVRAFGPAAPVSLPECSLVSVDYSGYLRAGPANTPWLLEFTASASGNWAVYTGPSRTGILVASGTCVTGANSVPIAYNAPGLAGTSVLLYLSLD